MKCAARTKAGTLCERNHTSGCTVRGADGWVYFLCRQHYNIAGLHHPILDIVQMPSRGHKADQHWLDLSSNVQLTWIFKEEINMDDMEAVVNKIDHNLLMGEINDRYSKNFNVRDLRITTEVHSIDDPARPGWIYVGSDYYGRISLREGVVILDRNDIDAYAIDLTNIFKKEVNNVTNTIHIKCRKCGIEADVTKDSESYKRFKANGGLCKNCSAKTKAEAHSSNPDERIVKVTCGKGENRHKWETTLAEFRQHKGICPEHR